MNAGAYEFAALAMRYVFAALMTVIALRAWRITVIDSRRAAKLRRLSPETGLSGELVVLEGDERAKRGMRYPVIREGMIGTSRRADVRIRHSSVRRRHAYFQLTEKGLLVRGHAGARLRDPLGHMVRSVLMVDGDHIGIGRVHLLLVLSEAADQEIRIVPRRKKPRRPEHRAAEDAYWDEDGMDDLFDVNGEAADLADDFAEYAEPRRKDYDDEGDIERWFDA